MTEGVSLHGGLEPCLAPNSSFVIDARVLAPNTPHCMRMTLRTGWWMMALAVMLPALGCKKDLAQSAGSAAEGKQPIAPSSWAMHAAKLGFVAHLPADTEACFGTLNLPVHTAALKQTNYFKDLTAFLDDKMPAPTAGTEKISDKPKLMEKLMGGDFFISMGKGAAKSIRGWQKLSSFYTEMTYRNLMAGVTPGAKPGRDGKDQMLNALIKDPDLVKRLAAALVDVEFPPLTVGVRTDKPDEVLKDLLPDDLLAQLKKKARVSQVTTNLNGKFTLIEATGKALLTDEMKRQWLDGLGAAASASQAEIGNAVDALQAKPFTLAYGTTDGYLIVSLGNARPSLQFATDASTSLISRPEFGTLAPYEGKSLLAVFFAEGGALQSMQNPEPLQPIARGLLAGLEQNPLFAALAKTLESKVAALATIEHELHARPMNTVIGAAWWDKGLHIETEGGLNPKGLDSGKPLSFASLLEDPNVVLATSYHADAQLTAALRAYFEGLADVLHVAGQGLAKAGMFGEPGPKMATWIDLEVVPQLVSFYNGSKTLYSKALGDEHAWVIDLGGRMPPIPGLAAADPKTETKMVRIVALDDVADRKLIGSSWLQMNDALDCITKAFPMLAGQKMPKPDVSNSAGVTCYSYPLPTGSDDLLPCVSVSDKLFMLGTSKNLQQDIAARLLRATPGTGTPTMLWRLNCQKLREAVKSFSPAASAAPAADNMKAATKWMEPLGDLRGRMWIESGRVRNSISWEMKDTIKFD